MFVRCLGRESKLHAMRPTRSGEVRLMEIVWVGSFEGFMNFSSNTPYPIKIVMPVCASLGAFGGLVCGSEDCHLFAAGGHPARPRSTLRWSHWWRTHDLSRECVRCWRHGCVILFFSSVADRNCSCDMETSLRRWALCDESHIKSREHVWNSVLSCFPYFL